jgi:hypothetical protein
MDQGPGNGKAPILTPLPGEPRGNKPGMPDRTPPFATDRL